MFQLCQAQLHKYWFNSLISDMNFATNLKFMFLFGNEMLLQNQFSDNAQLSATVMSLKSRRCTLEAVCPEPNIKHALNLYHY